MKKNSNDSDSLLVEKAKEGNEGAFNFLMNKYYPRVYASLFSFTKSKEDSEDLAQQTFMRVWDQINSFRGDSAFFTWVYRIAINLAKNFVASANYRKQSLNSSIDEFEMDFSSFNDVESLLIHDESLKKISNYVDTLPESLKTSFILREESGKTYEEISEMTDTPIGTVRSRIFRARELVIDFIKKDLIIND
jgi:RNA polymerase sigma-70 factor (ECF subfamily)